MKPLYSFEEMSTCDPACDSTSTFSGVESGTLAVSRQIIQAVDNEKHSIGNKAFILLGLGMM